MKSLGVTPTSSLSLAVLFALERRRGLHQSSLMKAAPF
jgi:hypothetical protein